MADTLRKRLTRHEVKQALANNQDLVNKDRALLGLLGRCHLQLRPICGVLVVYEDGHLPVPIALKP
jgi:hypothetical protein